MKIKTRTAAVVPNQKLWCMRVLILKHNKMVCYTKKYYVCNYKQNIGFKTQDKICMCVCVRGCVHKIASIQYG